MNLPPFRLALLILLVLACQLGVARVPISAEQAAQSSFANWQKVLLDTVHVSERGAGQAPSQMDDDGSTSTSDFRAFRSFISRSASAHGRRTSALFKQEPLWLLHCALLM